MAATQYLGDVPLYPRSTYVAALRTALPDTALAPARSRLLLIPLYLAIIAVTITAIARGWLPWPVVPVVSIALGVVYACMTFVVHELLHGGVVRNKLVQHVAGWFGFVPFTLSPRLWMAWHNSIHHGNTNLDNDPDRFATLEQYQTRGTTRIAIDYFSMGGRRWRGVLTLLLGFTGQSTVQLITAHTFLSRREHLLVLLETALSIAVWVTIGILVGPLAFVFVFVIPLLVANTCVMAFILTNHNLSPLVSVNDPLVNGLSVTVPRVVDWITLGFGFHVEHHLFPAMSSRHAPVVRALVLARWPERYQSMSLAAALSTLHNTARVYKDPTTLYDPKTGATFPVLLPR
jgi:fatty acid desaturase